MAQRTARLGRALNVWYRGGAVSILLNVLSIILGFGIASAWQARQDELRDLRGQLAVLNPLSDEVAFNASRAAELVPPADQPALCKVEGFQNAAWNRLSATAEIALLDPLLYKQIEDAYTDLDVALGPIGQRLRGSKCVEQLKLLAQTFDKLSQVMGEVVKSIKVQMRERAKEPATAGLINFVGRMLGLLMLVLLLPGAVYWAMVVLLRFVR
jgi:hypothetical protein